MRPNQVNDRGKNGPNQVNDQVKTVRNKMKILYVAGTGSFRELIGKNIILIVLMCFCYEAIEVEARYRRRPPFAIFFKKDALYYYINLELRFMVVFV